MDGETKTYKHQGAIERLKTDPVRNSSILGFIKNNPISLILSEGESFLVKGTSDRDWIYISSKNKEELRRLLQCLKEDDLCFASLEDWMIQEVTLKRKTEWQLTTARYFLPGDAVISDNKIELDSLNVKDAEYIIENSDYKQFLTIEYLKHRIKQSFTAGVIKNNKLVAWALTHDDGAIGALYVLDGFRNKDYATEIVCNLSRKIREPGNIPIAQIEEKNIPAIKLFEKLGFVKDRRVTWLKLS